MSEDSTTPDPTGEQWAAFQKIWTETFAKLMQAGFSGPSASPPPEFLRQMRSGIFQALSQSWDQFLRSPQFLESMKQWMDNAVTFRRMTTDFLTRARHETQGTAREDIDSVILAIQHSEKRVLTRLEEVSARVDALQARVARAEAAPATAATPPTGIAARRRERPAARRRTPRPTPTRKGRKP